MKPVLGGHGLALRMTSQRSWGTRSLYEASHPAGALSSRESRTQGCVSPHRCSGAHWSARGPSGA